MLAGFTGIWTYKAISGLFQISWIFFPQKTQHQFYFMSQTEHVGP